VPGITPVIVPVSEPIAATDGALLVQVPPGTKSVIVTGTATQIVAGPMIGPGTGLTVITVVIKQPVAVMVYFIVVMPGMMPVTTPVVGATVATAGALLLQVPPGVTSVTVIVVPGHNAVGPPIAAGNGLTVIVALPLIVLVQPVVAPVANTV
jgi:hypothetical protein